jgi:hypothetical protein
MPRATRNGSDDLVSIAAAAKEIGYSPSTLARQVKAGSIRSHGGKVRLSEVLADRAANIDSSRWIDRERNGRTPKSLRSGGGHAPVARRAQDNAQAHATTCTGIALTPDLTRDLGLVLESQDTSDALDVGTDCVLVGLEMIEETVRRLRAENAALKAKGTQAHG